MKDLNKAQRAMLAAAAARRDGAVAQSGGKNGARIAAPLIAAKLLRKCRTKPGMPVWRKDETGVNYSLVLTKAGRAAIAKTDIAGVEREASADLRARDASRHRDAANPHRGKSANTPRPRENERSEKAPNRERNEQHASARLEKNPASPRGMTKRARIVALLSRDEGATLADLMDATGWLPHTTRAALTGLRQSGCVLERRPQRDVRCSVYRILTPATDAA